MAIHLAFLRAVNIGKRPYPMAELREVLTAAGYDDVATHIQTGNVRLRTRTRSAAKVGAELEALFAADRGFEVQTIILSPAELLAIAEDVDKLSEQHEPAYGHYVSLLKAVPSAAVVTALEERSVPGERIVVRDRAVHQLLDLPYHESKLTNTFVEKAAGAATNRNAKVIRAIREKWCT